MLLHELIAELARQGKTILYISHVLEVTEKVCSRVIMLYQGKIVANDEVGRLRDLMHLPSLEQIFRQLAKQEDVGAAGARDRRGHAGGVNGLPSRCWCAISSAASSITRSSRRTATCAPTWCRRSGFVAVPGMFAPFYMLPQRRALRPAVRATTGMLISDYYFFVLYSMVVMGFVMVFEWDALFPGPQGLHHSDAAAAGRRLDLPGEGRWRWSLFLGLFVLDANFLGTLLAPLVTGGDGHAVPHRLAARWRRTRSPCWPAGIFVALCIRGTAGRADQLLTGRAFRRVSPWAQMASMAFLITILFLTPSWRGAIRPLFEQHSPLLRWFPPFWFLALYHGSAARAVPAAPLFHELAPLARQRARRSAAAVFAVTYLAGYRAPRAARDGEHGDDGRPVRAGCARGIRAPRERAAAAASAGARDVPLHQQHHPAKRAAPALSGDLWRDRGRAGAADVVWFGTERRARRCSFSRRGTAGGSADPVLPLRHRTARRPSISRRNCAPTGSFRSARARTASAHPRRAEVDRADGARAADRRCCSRSRSRSAAGGGASSTDLRAGARAGDAERAADLVPQDPVHLLVLPGQDEHGGDGAGVHSRLLCSTW